MIPDKFKWPVMILSLVLIAQFLYLRKEPEDYCGMIRATYLSETWKGLIVAKFLDKKNHMYRTLVIQSTSALDTLQLSNDSGDLYERSNIGDSILKSMSSFDVLLKPQRDRPSKHKLIFRCHD